MTELKRGRGRLEGFVMTERHRSKISKSQILNRLIKAAEGELEISAVSASVGLGLMRKVMPDLQATEITGQIEQTYVVRMPAVVADLGVWKAEQPGNGELGQPSHGPLIEHVVKPDVVPSATEAKPTQDSTDQSILKHS